MPTLMEAAVVKLAEEYTCLQQRGSLPESLKPPWKDIFVFSEARWASGTLGVTKGNVFCSPAHCAIVRVPSEQGF